MQTLEVEQSTELIVKPENVDIVPGLTIDARRAKVWDLRVRGVSVASIAKALGCSDKTVYDDLREIGKRYREELLQMDAMEILATNIQWLDEMERVTLFEAAQAEPLVIKEKDLQTGKVIERKITDPNKARYIQAALKARELKLKLLIDTGVLPRNKIELFDKLGSLTASGGSTNEERTEEEIKQSIERLMKHGRLMKPASGVEDA